MIQEKTALVIVDCQNDFFEEGSLPVPDSLKIIPVINQLKRLPFELCSFTKDSHPLDHISFATNHENSSPYTTIDVRNGDKQELWPNHCVQGTFGHDIHKDIDYNSASDLTFYKGTLRDYESYSGFGNDHEDTGLLRTLQRSKIKKLFVCGLAYDFCVGNTAIDAAKYGFEAYIVMDGTKPVAKTFAEEMDLKLQQHRNIHKVELKDLGMVWEPDNL